MPTDRMLEDDRFRVVGRVTLESPSGFQVDLTSSDAQSWAPTLYAFRIGGEVLRIGKTQGELLKRVKQWNRNVSRALAGDFHKGGTNPWEAFEWRKSLRKHTWGEFLAQRWSGDKKGLRSRETELVNRYDPRLNNEGPSGRLRPQPQRSVRNVAAANEYWQQLNRSVEFLG